MAKGQRTKVPRVALFYLNARTSLLRGVAKYVRHYGPWEVYRRPSDPEEMMPHWLRQWDGDGVIGRVINKQTADLLRSLGIPYVDIRGAVRDPQMPLVHGDDAAVGQIAAEHLLDRGFRQFGFYGFPGEIWSDQRCQAFVKAVSDAGCLCEIYQPPHFPAGPREWDQAKDHLADWLEQLPKPAAVMGANDDFGEQVLWAARRKGIRVPDELAVIGVDNNEAVCEVSDPPLSSVVQDQETLGYRAAELLDSLMRGEPKPTEPIYIRPSGICTRQSTDVLAIDDPFIATAVGFIRRHACSGITVTDVLRQVPLSRSVLQRRFRRILGQSPSETIVNARIQRAQQLLLETDESLAKIAEVAGFRHQQYLGAVFRQHLGVTPSQFRKRAKGGPRTS